MPQKKSLVQMRWLYYLVAAVDNQGHTAAANALGISQGSISKAIGQLEKDFGLKIFERKGKYLELSPAGEILVGYARRVVQEMDLFQEALLKISKGKIPEPAKPIVSTKPDLKVKLTTANREIKGAIEQLNAMQTALSGAGKALSAALAREVKQPLKHSNKISKHTNK